MSETTKVETQVEYSVRRLREHVALMRRGDADSSCAFVASTHDPYPQARVSHVLDALDAALARAETAEGMARKAVEDFGDLVAGRASLKDIAVRNGALNASVETEIGPVIASLVITMLGDADNYVEMRVRDPQTLKEYVVTALRGEGKTPHELRREAEARVAALTAERDALAKDAARWRYVRGFITTDGDVSHPDGGDNFEFVRIEDERLCEATTRKGWFLSVDDLIDAAINLPTTEANHA